MKQKNSLRSNGETLDTFYHGRIRVLQRKTGFRFAVDAPLLADFIQTQETDCCLEIGTGCGIISLLLSIKPFSHITAVEIQETLADLARRNVCLNGLEERITVICTDFLTFQPARKYDVVFANPPYIPAHTGRVSTSLEKSIAKHELKCDIFDIMQKTSEFLKKKGKAYFIFSAKRRQDFSQAVRKGGLKMRISRLVYPRLGRHANFFLAECDFFSPLEKELPPLILFDKQGQYSAEAQEIFAGRIHAPSA
jgi:tRNA1(Val) A37 N6-methylase TrmN6